MRAPGSRRQERERPRPELSGMSCSAATPSIPRDSRPIRAPRSACRFESRKCRIAHPARSAPCRKRGATVPEPTRVPLPWPPSRTSPPSVAAFATESGLFASELAIRRGLVANSGHRAGTRARRRPREGDSCRRGGPRRPIPNRGDGEDVSRGAHTATSAPLPAPRRLPSKNRDRADTSTGRLDTPSYPIQSPRSVTRLALPVFTSPRRPAEAPRYPT